MNMREWRAWMRRSWEIISTWEIVKVSIFQKLFTYNLPPTSSLLSNKDLSNISVIVTGSTSGIGLHTAKEFAMAGAHVIMACNNVRAGKEIACMWREETSNVKIINVEVMELDLLSFSSIRRFVVEWEQRSKPLDILINNAGILLMEEPQRFSGVGIEQHMHVNHIGPALLILLLLPSLLKAPSARIINVSSVTHHCGVVEPQYWNSRMEEHKFNSIKAYGSSKLIQIMFLKFLANKLFNQKRWSIQCISVHPGIVATNLNASVRRKLFWMFDPAEGARSVIFCGTSDTVEHNLVKGFAYYSCNCMPSKISPKTNDMEACLEVWQKTLEILELNHDYLSHVLESDLY